MHQEKSARFCKAHLGFHSHQTSWVGSFHIWPSEVGFICFAELSPDGLWNGKVFPGFSFSAMSHGEGARARRKEALRWVQKPCSPPHHFILYTLHHKALHNQWQNIEGLEIQQMDHYHLFLWSCWGRDGMKVWNPLNPLCSAPVGAPEDLVWHWFPEEEPWTPLQGQRTTWSDGSSCKPSPTLNPARLFTGQPPFLP